jgi:hypothetical protein
VDFEFSELPNDAPERRDFQESHSAHSQGKAFHQPDAARV